MRDVRAHLLVARAARLYVAAAPPSCSLRTLMPSHHEDPNPPILTPKPTYTHPHTHLYSRPHPHSCHRADTRHTARFLSAWLLLLPLGLWDQFSNSWNHLALLPAATIVAIFLFGIEELAVQLEVVALTLTLTLTLLVWD